MDSSTHNLLLIWTNSSRVTPCPDEFLFTCQFLHTCLCSEEVQTYSSALHNLTQKLRLFFSLPVKTVVRFVAKSTSSW